MSLFHPKNFFSSLRGLAAARRAFGLLKASFLAALLSFVLLHATSGPAWAGTSSVVITGNPALTNVPFTVTITFSEAVNGFVVGDITVGNGAASAFTGVDGATVYTALITPAADGLVTIDVGAGVANATVGNEPNTAAPQVTSTFDGTPPTLIITAPVKATGPFTATFTFIEDVTGFVVGDITVGNGAAGTFVAVSATVYTAVITPTPGANGATTLDVAGGVAQDLATNPNTDAAQVTIGFTDETFTRTRTQRVIANFLGRRADQMTANGPNLVNRLNGGANGAGGPIGFTGSGTPENNQLTFATSLRQIFNAGEAGKAKRRDEFGQMMSLGQQSSMARGGMQSGLDIWLQGSWARTTSGKRQSDIGIAYLGADYQTSPALLVGVMLQLDWSDEKDKTLATATAADGNGWMAGPYVVARLGPNVLFDARGAWGQSDNKVSPFGTYTDKFDADRWLASARITGDFDLGAWRFAPHAGVIYFQEKPESYTDSLGVFIPGKTVSLGRVTFGPKISTSIERANGAVISPHLAIKGIWDFDKAKIVSLTTGLAVGSDDLRARAEGGVVMQMPNGVSLSSEGFYDGIGASSYESYGGSVTLRIPLQRGSN